MTEQKKLAHLVHEAQAMAAAHTLHCDDLFRGGELEKALEYCQIVGVEAPKCSLTAKSANADRVRAIANGLMGSEKWWIKQLKIMTLRKFEHEQIKSGKVSNAISDEVFEFIKS